MNLLTDTIDLLKKHKYYGCGEHIEIAKGKNAIPKTWKQAWEQIRRYSFTK